MRHFFAALAGFFVAPVLMVVVGWHLIYGQQLNDYHRAYDGVLLCVGAGIVLMAELLVVSVIESLRNPTPRSSWSTWD